MNLWFIFDVLWSCLLVLDKVVVYIWCLIKLLCVSAVWSYFVCLCCLKLLWRLVCFTWSSCVCLYCMKFLRVYVSYLIIVCAWIGSAFIFAILRTFKNMFSLPNINASCNHLSAGEIEFSFIKKCVVVPQKQETDEVMLTHVLNWHWT
jgi:hypothetical protein